MNPWRFAQLAFALFIDWNEAWLAFWSQYNKRESATPVHGQAYRAIAFDVRAPKDGYHRAGRTWTRGTITVPIEELSPDQVQDLLDDPELEVIPVTEDEPLPEADGDDPEADEVQAS
jgi:hypothetical protein